MITDFEAALSVLAAQRIEFIVVGGVAAALHGSSFVTQDLNLVYSRQLQNIERLAAALQPHAPYLRGAPPGLPFQWDTATIRNGLNFTLTTNLGAIDFMGEIAGGGTYEQLLPYTQTVAGFGLTFQIVTLHKLIALKRAAGRPKDLTAAAELQAILQSQSREGLAGTE